MRSSIIYIFFLLVVFSCNDNSNYDGFIIEGEISGYKNMPARVEITNGNSDSPVVYTAGIKNGEFVIRGRLTTPELFTLKLSGVDDSLEIFVTNSLIKIKGIAEDLPGAFISGSTENELVSVHKREHENLSINLSINSILKLKDSTGRYLLTPETEAKVITYTKRSLEIDSLFIEKHPSSYYAAQILFNRADEFSIGFREKMTAFYHSLPQFTGNRFVLGVEDKTKADKAIKKGNIAPDFNVTDNEGYSYSFLGVSRSNKVTMLYFWAGWCDACLNFNNYINTFYNSFKWRGFEIVGVSLDKNESDFEKSLKSGGVSWINLSDFKGWSSPIALKYRIREIPSVILVDSTGEIFSVNPTRRELKQIIRERLLSPRELNEYLNKSSDTTAN